MKIISIIGARPQFVKAAPLSRALRQNHQEYLLHTGQHYDGNMSKIFFDDLEIPRPDLNLNVGSASHAAQTAEMMVGIEKAVVEERPDLVLLYGDTNSTVAAALAATKLHVPVAHVEAGLRSFNWDMPEEINRIVTDRISQFLFCPTQTAMANLRTEGLAQKSYLVGDVMVDALYHFSKIAQKKVDPLTKFGVREKSYSVATIHRPANTDNPQHLKSILAAFRDSGEKIIFPVHPRTRQFLQQHGLTNSGKENLILTEPLSYLEILLLEKSARTLLTDSGGMQKEAYLWGTPCITLRDETEWVETVEQGWNVLVGADYDKILTALRNFHPDTPRTFS
ncbi:MAG TPA: UDP-N-acetylglucosamine 2-epimerase (non-hydrolyzing), partial [Bacteroidetes bacterium]|nr:UDP-N-acetylglucosamine 2-epimerase (non-hydrolyzing) [Bacteroidota bacterium]